MVYTFARVSAVLRMRVRDYFVQGRRGWVRLHEKGGKEHTVPCHHNLELYLDSYLACRRHLPGISTGRFSGRPPAAPGCSPPNPCGSRTPTA